MISNVFDFERKGNVSCKLKMLTIMWILNSNYVVLVLLIINILFHPIENRPNDHGLRKTQMRQRRKDSVVNTKWFSQSRMPHKFVSHDNKNNIVDDPRHRGLYKRKIHGIENADFDSSVDGRGNPLLPEMKPKRKSRQFVHQNWSQQDRSVTGEKTMQLDQFLSLTKTNKFKLIASLKSLDQRDFKRYPHTANTSFPLAFNITLRDHVMSTDQAKLNLYLHHGNEKINDLPPCFCKLQMHELSDPGTTNRGRVTLYNMIVTRPSWYSVDVTEIVIGRQTPGLILLNLNFNCTPVDLKETNSLNQDTLFGKTHCVLNLLKEDDFHKNPILTLFSLKETHLDVPSSDYKSYEKGSQNGRGFFGTSSSRIRYFTTKHDQRIRSVPETFQFLTDFHRNLNDDKSLNVTQRFPVEKVDPSIHSTARRRLKRRARRHRGGRNSCRRKELYVDFEKMKWGDFILYPRGYQVFQCVGRCYSPISKYLTPTTHAVIQNLVHMSHPKKVSRVCCVPTKLKSLSILFYDADMNLDNRLLKDMVVTECGCR